MSVVVNLSLATICFLNQCYPALIGKTTPSGRYQLHERRVITPGHGGDVLTFKEGPGDLFAIHRVWLGSPREARLARLASTDIARRRDVTGGCVNILPDVYSRLVDCCYTAELTIK